MDEQWLRASSDVEEAAALTAHLVSFRSNPSKEGDVQRTIAAWLRENSIDAELTPTEEENRPNVIARVENGAGPTLLLNGHVDTVLAAEGWQTDPWTATRDGDRLYGLGAGDMKAGVVAAMLATRALHQRRDLWHGTLIFTSVVDEEAYSIGARALVKANIEADACLCVEPGWDHPVLGAPGKVLIRGEVTGKAAHGARPRLGINAAVEAAKFLARVDDLPLGQHPRLESSQCVLGMRSGNEQYVVVVPETAHFIISRHIVPGETGETVLAQMRDLAATLDSPARFDLSIDQPYYPPWEIASDHPVVQQFARAYETELGHAPTFGYSEAVADDNYFAADLGIPTVRFGPLGAGFHQPNEWVDVTTIAATTRIVLRLATDMMG